MILFPGFVGGSPPTLTRTHLEQLSTTSFGSFCCVLQFLQHTNEQIGEENL